MKMNLVVPAIAAGLAAVVLSGCVISQRTSYREDPGPYGYGPRSDVIIVHRPPPPMPYEQIMPPPGPGYVWVPGYWEGRGDQWYWVRGQYVRPPRPNAVWVEPRYVPRSSTEIEFSVGGWR